ncbi:MAG: ribbon-helix-helix domain-containing protein [Methanobrevibacter sp.]|nr:ribbon-helix-helix domain-containing protein [Methanobrevibacter sp.]
MLSTEKLAAKTLSTKLTPNEVQEIDNLVNAGLYLNSSDFLREAVRERLKAIKIIKLRDIDYDTAKKEILGYYKKYNKAFMSDVADDLELDIELVVNITDELIKEGRIKEV